MCPRLSRENLSFQRVLLVRFSPFEPILSPPVPSLRLQPSRPLAKKACFPARCAVVINPLASTCQGPEKGAQSPTRKRAVESLRSSPQKATTPSSAVYALSPSRAWDFRNFNWQTSPTRNVPAKRGHPNILLRNKLLRKRNSSMEMSELFPGLK